MMAIWGETIIRDLITWVLAFSNRIGMWRTPLGNFDARVVEIPLGVTTLVPLLKPRGTRLSRGPTFFVYKI
jgi:hypothetical protein